MEEFKTYTLEELSLNKGTYGIAASAVPYDDSKLTYLRITDINDDGTLNTQSLMSVDEPNASDYLLKKNDIVFARTGNSTGRTYFYQGNECPLVYAGFLIKFSIDEKKVNPLLLKYYTHSRIYYDWVKSFDTGGTRGNINAKTYGNMPIRIPASRKTQDKIVDILSSLDEKIALNRRINDNLEQQAQALFAEVFESDHTFTQLGAVIETCSGGTPSRNNLDYYIDGTICWVKSKELNRSFLFDTEEKIAQVGIDRSSAKLLPKNSVLIAMYGATVGEYCIIDKPMTCNQAICALLPSSDYPASYLYMFIKQKRNELINLAVGSAQQNISQVLIKGLSVSANLKLIAKFDKMVMPIFNMIRKNVKESIILEAERNTLLPRLMSGELKINDLNC